MQAQPALILVKLFDDNVEGVIVEGKGHWLIDEAPEKVIPALDKFLSS